MWHHIYLLSPKHKSTTTEVANSNQISFLQLRFVCLCFIYGQWKNSYGKKYFIELPNEISPYSEDSATQERVAAGIPMLQ